MFAAHTCVGAEQDRPHSATSARADSETASSTSWAASGSSHGHSEAGSTSPVLVSSWALKKQQRKSKRFFACFSASSCSDDVVRAQADVHGLRTGSIFLDDGPARPTLKEAHIMSTSKICDNALFEDEDD